MKIRALTPFLAVALLATAVIPAKASVTTVVLTDPPRVVQLVLQPKRTTVLRFDRPIQTVAAGNPSVLKVEVVGPPDRARDLLLIPAAASGDSDLTVWIGDAGDTMITLWELRIGERSTAALVFVVSPLASAPARQQPQANTPSSPSGTEPPQAAPGPKPNPAPSPKPPQEQAPGGQTTATPPPPKPQPSEPARDAQTALIVQSEQDGITATFQVFRSRTGAVLRYRLDHKGEKPYRVVPSRIAVWVNRNAIAHALIRTASNPDVLEPGSIEAGVITLPGDVREVRIIIPLFPVREEAVQLPLIFEASFVGIDRLAVTP